MTENIIKDKKSLKSVVDKSADFGELAGDCVAFANARGGRLYIGIEDDASTPPIDQKIPEGLPEKIIKRINELTYNVALRYEVATAENNGQYIILSVLPSASSVAATTKGVYFIRDDDKSRRVMPDELTRLVSDKSAYCWEAKVSLNVKWENCDQDKLNQFISDIKSSDRVKYKEHCNT